MLNVIDDYNREALGMEIDFSLPSERVIRALKQIIEWRGRPLITRCDNGPEKISGAIQNWAEDAGIAFQYIQPGRPQQNAYVERFNRTVRYEWLGQNYWENLSDVRDFTTQWAEHYNLYRPNMALDGTAPKQRLAMAAWIHPSPVKNGGLHSLTRRHSTIGYFNPVTFEPTQSI